MDRVNDLVEFRIDAVLQEMSGSTLCVLPEDEAVTCEEFVQTTRVNKYSLFQIKLSSVVLTIQSPPVATAPAPFLSPVFKRIFFFSKVLFSK